MRLALLLGTRPEIIKMSMVIKELEKFYSLCIIHTGQNYSHELNEVFFSDLELRNPDYILNYSANNAIRGIAQMLTNVDDILDNEYFDALLVFGDTNSCLSAYSAKRRHIPVIHLEAGNRSFDDRIPEEVNRRIIDAFSDANLCLSEYARDYLLRAGNDPRLTINVGSPIGELFSHHVEKIESSEILKKFGLEPKKYFVLSTHREENVDNHLSSILLSVDKISGIYDSKCLVSVHPRIKSKINLSEYSNLIFTTALGLFDYWCLQKNSLCVLSDSGTLTEESIALNFAAVNIRESHERPEGDRTAALTLTGRDFESIKLSVEISINHNQNRQANYQDVVDYQDKTYSKKIARLLPGLVLLINRIKYNKV